MVSASRRRRPEDWRQPLVALALTASIDRTTDGIQDRVRFAMRALNLSAKEIAPPMGVTGEQLSRWRNRHGQAPRLDPSNVASQLAPVLNVSRDWLLTGSVGDGYPDFLEEIHDWVDALTAVAAVQLYGLLTLRLCPPIFFQVLDEGSLAGASPVDRPFPDMMQKDQREPWEKIMRRIPFLPAEAQGSLIQHWGALTIRARRPESLFSGDFAGAILLACCWAKEWQQKMNSAACTSAA
jgi:transposase-like protein